jgi:hypothetical protein
MISPHVQLQYDWFWFCVLQYRDPFSALVRFIMAPIIQEECDIFRERHNTSLICKQARSGCPSGVPVHMYEHPENFKDGAKRCGFPVDGAVLDFIRSKVQATWAPRMVPGELQARFQDQLVHIVGEESATRQNYLIVLRGMLEQNRL